MQLSINPNSISIKRETDKMYGCHDFVFANIGFGDRELISKDGVYYTVKLLKTKTKEMTLDEIEKKLGHKVKIINK